jgi:hypothetical protein
MKIAISYDSDGWAWHKRAAGISKYAPKGMQVDAIRQDVLNKSDAVYDIVLHQSWGECRPHGRHGANWTMVASEGLLYNIRPQSKHLPQRTASVTKNKTLAHRKLRNFDGVICINENAIDFCKSINPNTHWLKTAVDDEVYYPESHTKDSDDIRIGWCGKRPVGSRWTPKGFDEVLIPLSKSSDLIERITWCINSRTAENAMDGESMRAWYNSLDLFLVTSTCEGTPSTLLEAMACGIPVVSTDVGIAKRALCMTQSGNAAGVVVDGYTTEDEIRGTIDAIHDALVMVNREWCIANGRACATIIRECGWTWKVQSPRWIETMIRNSR